MELDIEILKRLKKKSINSKVKFRDDFKWLINKALIDIESWIKNEIWTKYNIKYFDIWNNNIKIKIEDKNKNLEKLIDCILRHTKAEEQYWYVIVEIVIHEYSKKQKSYILWKYSIKNSNLITYSITDKIKETIDEI